MACGRIKHHIKEVENNTTGGDCLSEFEYNEDAISELLIKISETAEFKRIEHLILCIRKQYLNFMFNSRQDGFAMPKFLETLADVSVDMINCSGISAAAIMQYMIEHDVNNWVHYYYMAFLVPLFSNDNQESREKAENLFIHVFVGYLLDLLGDRKVEIGHVRDGEILTHERNKYDLSIVNGVEFKSSFFIFDGKAYMYGIHMDIEPLRFGDTMPGFARIITDKVTDGNILLRLDDRLALPIDEFFSGRTLDFDKYRGPAFRFNDSVLKQPKTLIIHYDPVNYNKLLMVIKKDYDEKINQPFWHIEIETLPCIPDNRKMKNVITTFLHGMYYINEDYFSHIDCTKNQYSINSYMKKYNEEGDTTADLYTEDGYHYKLWCIEDGKYSREIWYELMIVSLPETYQKLLNEIINDEIDI